MPEIERLTITLPADMASLIRNAVEGGDYASSSEVVREALREWKMRRSLRQHELEELRRLWEEGLANGPGRFEDVEAIKAEARRLLQLRELALLKADIDTGLTDLAEGRIQEFDAGTIIERGRKLLSTR